MQIKLIFKRLYIDISIKIPYAIKKLHKSFKQKQMPLKLGNVLSFPCILNTSTSNIEQSKLSTQHPFISLSCNKSTLYIYITIPDRANKSNNSHFKLDPCSRINIHVSVLFELRNFISSE